MVDEYWMSAWTPLSNLKGWVCSLTDAEDFLNVYRSIKGHFIGDKKSPNFGLHEVFNDALAQRSPSEIETELAEAEKSILPDQPACDTEESTPAHEPLKPVKARPKWIVRPRIQVGPQKGAGDRSLDLRSYRVRFSSVGDDDVIPNDGVPFIIAATYTMSCVYGRNKHICAQRRVRALREAELQNDEPPAKKRRKRLKTSKKIGCPARIVMKEVIRFPEFQLDRSEINSKYVQGVTSRALREAMRASMHLVTEHRIFISVPKDEDHNSIHPIGVELQVPKMMQAVQQAETGGPEVLGLVEVPVPKPGPREILMRIHASAINRADTLQRRGLYPLPPGSTPIFGLEAAGEICDLGNSSPHKWKIGDRVMALLPGGGNAQYATAHEDHLIPVPDHLTIQQAAAIPEVWLTAFQLLFFVASLKKGDVVLIHAGGSGVGTAATQLVKQAGGIAIVTAGTEAKLEKARSLGAAEAFNYKEVDFAEKVLEVTEGKGANIILDCVGGSYWEKNVKAIAPDGTWVVYGLMGGRNVEGALLGDILRKRISIRGTTLRPRSDQYKAELIKAFSEKALPHFTPSSPGKQPQFQPIVDRVFPLEEISAAHQYMEENKTLGKVILSVSHLPSKPSEEL